MVRNGLRDIDNLPITDHRIMNQCFLKVQYCGNLVKTLTDLLAPMTGLKRVIPRSKLIKF